MTRQSSLPDRHDAIRFADWTSLAELRPLRSDEYLVCNEFSGETACLWFDEEDGFEGQDGAYPVTHWMERPAAYRRPEPSAAIADMPAIELAHGIGAHGTPHSELERHRFESYMRGHCWAVSEWDEARGCYREMNTRVFFALWRDRAALGLEIERRAQAQSFAQLPGPVWPEPDPTKDDCANCYHCLAGRLDARGCPLIGQRMIVCQQCGDKRCSKAADHHRDCAKKGD